MTEYTITEAAKLYKVERQAVHVAIKKKKLKAHLNEKKIWMIDKSDLKEWHLHKYDREKSKFMGEPLIGEEEFTPIQLCYYVQERGKIDINLNRIYYLLEKGEIKSYRKGGAFIIDLQEANALIERERKYLNIKIQPNQRRFA